MKMNKAMPYNILEQPGFRTYDAVVLCDGDFPIREPALSTLLDAPYIVCCDGAANGYINKGYTPDAIIGDGDSLSPIYREHYRSLIVFNEDQQTNDQTKAVQFIIEQGKEDVLILGATGKREDHTLGNISLLIEYLRMGLQIRMLTDHGLFIPSKNNRKLNTYPGQQISIFNFGATDFSAKGLKYPVRDFTDWWQGTLNEAQEKQIEIDAQGEYIIYLNL